MTLPIGILSAGALLGLQAVRIRPKRLIGTIEAQVTIEESHRDDLEITDHPVELGAPVSDHAFKRPREVIIKCGWSNSPSSPGFLNGLGAAATGTLAGVASLTGQAGPQQTLEIYQKLLALQESRVPFDILTGKTKYSNMLIATLTTVTDEHTENTLMVTLVCRQVIIVNTQVVAIPADRQKQAAATQGVQSKGAQQLKPVQGVTAP